MRTLSVILILLAASVAASSQVKIEVKADRISVEIDGKPFTDLYKGVDANKPYFHPLRSASGKPVTRAFPMEKVAGEDTDHPHQRAMWVGFEHLSGINFWENDPSDTHPRTGKIVFGDVIEKHDGASSGGFTISAQWINPEGKAVLDETLGLTFYGQRENLRMFDVDLRLKAKLLVTFEDHKDGIIGFRLGTAFDENHGGKAVDAEGVQGTEHLDGIRTSWMNWQADLGGEKVGFVVMDHPANLNHPTSWLAKPMALFFANPFAQRYYDRSRANGSQTLQPGDEIRLRYRVIIHPPDFDIAAAYKEYSTQ